MIRSFINLLNYNERFIHLSMGNRHNFFHYLRKSLPASGDSGGAYYSDGRTHLERFNFPRRGTDKLV